MLVSFLFLGTFQKCFHTEGKLTVFDSGNFHFYFLTFFEYFVRAYHAFVRDLGYVNQTGETVGQADKCAIIFQSLYGAVHDVTYMYLLKSSFLFLVFCGSCFCSQNLSCGENQTFFLRIYCDDANAYFFVQPLVQVVYMLQRKTGCRDKSADTLYICDNTAVYHAADFNSQDGFVIHLLF